MAMIGIIASRRSARASTYTYARIQGRVYMYIDRAIAITFALMIMSVLIASAN